MYTAIKNYCENQNTNGLFLMDMPTGFGKTYSVLKYIFESCLKEENKNRLYFFITPLKKNLPEDELRHFFEKAGKIEEFYKKYLFIDSNSECAMKHYSEKMKSEIPSEITESKAFKHFEQEVEFLQKQRDSNDYALQLLLKNAENNFREHTEPAFRRLIQEKLEIFPDTKQRIHAIKNDRKWKWIGELYPAIFTQERQIIFLSMDKFLRKNSPIVEPSYYFYNSNLIDNAIIFIDEFDSSKETILNYIISNGLQGKIDPICLFKSIYSALKTNDFPKELTISFKTGRTSRYLDNLLKNMRKKAEKLYNIYELNFLHRTASDVENNDKNFLFQDYQFHSVLKGDNRYITSVSDRKAKQNIIHFTQTKPECEKYNIHSMLGELRGFIQLFQGMVSQLAYHYKKVRNKQHQNEENELTQEEAVRSVLDLFQLSKEDTDYLTTQIMLNKFRIEQDEKVEFDQSVYEKGFRYYCFENSALHHMRTRIMMCSFQNSPEKLLLQICKHAKVIGISATATISTVIGNFDLEYLQAKLHERYYILPDEEYERLSQEFHHSQIGYQSQIQIHTELLDTSDYSVQTWLNIFQDSDLAGEVYNSLEINVEKEGNSHYHHERYARIAMVFKEFLIHNDIQSMLCFLTKHPKENDDTRLNLRELRKVLKYVADSVHSDFNVKKSVICLTSDNYEREKKAITARLAGNEKLFVISTYQTIGAGQNLQYPVPESLKGKLICSNSYLPREEKDFDAIYLDKPTNLLVNMRQNWKEEDFAKYIFQIEFLQENAELSMKDAIEYIKMAFRCYMTGEKRRIMSEENIYHKKSIVMYATRIINQAIGRICRTNQKKDNIYIFADKRISDCIDLSVTDKRILNYEFLALIDKIKTIRTEFLVDETLKNKAELASTRSYLAIDHILNHEWTENTMRTWAKLRQFFMQHPTASKKEASENPIYRNYVELPEKNNVLYYNQNEDFHEVSIFFTQTKNTQTLNAENTRLPRLMKWQALYEYFISQGYATAFQPNDYILSPPFWNNIYKGALGEIVGSFWFQQVLGIQLEELTSPDEFELFDFKIEEKKIYIDFKNWSEATTRLFDDEIEKIKRKAKQCECRYVIIANILTRKNYEIRKLTYEGIDFLMIPSLLNDIEDGTICVNQVAAKEIKEIYQ